MKMTKGPATSPTAGKAITGGRLVHEDDGRVGNQLDGDGEALALLHAEPALPRNAHQRVAQWRQLHNVHHILDKLPDLRCVRIHDTVRALRRFRQPANVLPCCRQPESICSGDLLAT